MDEVYFRVETAEDNHVRISAKGSDEQIIQLLIDGICAFAAKSQSNLKAKEVVRIIDQELEEWE